MLILLFGCALLGRAEPLHAEPRLALVIGNGAYDARLGPLANPIRDARVMSAALKAAGFEVTLLGDLDQKGMKRAISDFGQRLSRAGSDATALFFYAGHGLQSRGVNYLIPVDAAIRSEADVDLDAVAADTVFRQMEEAGSATRIMILDACRNTPVLRTMRSGSRGLAPMEAPGGAFIAYSTAPGRTAVDGSGANSPFVTALVREMAVPGAAIEDVFRNVRRSVMAATGGEQIPWDASSLLGRFQFIRTADAAAASLSPPPAISPAAPSAKAAIPLPVDGGPRPQSAERFGIEIAVASLTETADRYVAVLSVRNDTAEDSIIAVEKDNANEAEIYLTDGSGGACQMSSYRGSWGSIGGWWQYDSLEDLTKYGTPLTAGSRTRHTIFFNKRSCESLLTARDDVILRGTFIVMSRGQPQRFPVAFDGLTLDNAGRGNK